MTQIGAISVKISADDSGFQAAAKRTAQGAQVAADQVQAAGQKMGGFTKAASTAGSAAGGLGRVAQQAGYQVQDFIVQVQGGQSAFVAFGQQGSQLAGILGPGGAVIGAVIALAAAIGGTLVKAMENAKNKTVELPKELVERLEKIKQSYLEIDEASRQAFSQVQLAKVGSEVDAVSLKIENLRAANVRLEQAQMHTTDPRAFRQYGQEIAANETKIRSLTKEQGTLAEFMSRVGQVVVTATGEWVDGAGQMDKYANSTENLIGQLTAAEMRFTEGELKARLYAAALATGKQAVEELDPALRAKIETLYALEQQQDAATEASKRMAEQDKIAREEMIAGMREEQAQREAMNKLRNELDALNNPAEKARQQLQERLEVIMEYHQLENEAQALRYEEGIAAEQAYQDTINQIEADAANQKLATQQRVENAIQSMRMQTVQSAINLLDQFAGQSKVAALASIALSKGLAFAQNAQNTLVAQTRALAELGPILGPPAAAKIGLYGKINGALIAATGLAQAGNVGNSSAQVFSGGVPATNTTSGSGGGSGPSRNISISLAGSSFGAGGIRDLIAQINEAVGDGVSLNVTSG